MSEYPPKIPPLEKLRQSLLIEDLERAPTDFIVRGLINPLAQVRTLAPVIKADLNLFGDLESKYSDRREFVRTRLEQRAADNGFGSVDELKSGLFGLRDQIKEEMPRKEWNIYFGENP